MLTGSAALHTTSLIRFLHFPHFCTYTNYMVPSPAVLGVLLYHLEREEVVQELQLELVRALEFPK